MEKYLYKNWFWFIGAFLLYINTLGHEYTIDDLIVVEKNSLTQKGINGIPEIFSHSYLFGYDGREDESYRPLTLTTFALERSISDANPTFSHLIQTLLYALTVLILFKLLKEIFDKKSIHFAAVATLLFMLHPIHTEVVANIKSRDELLCALFLFASLLVFIKFLRSKSKLKLILAAVLYFAATLSKETAIPAFILFPGLIWFIEKNDLKQTIVGSLFMIAPLGLYILIRSVVLSDVLIQDPIDPVANTLALAQNGTEQFATNLSIFTKYFQLSVFPVSLSWDYSTSHFSIVGISNPMALIGLLILVGLLALLIFGTIKRSILGFGALVFISTFAATSNFFFLINCTLGERFLFIPVLGMIIIVIGAYDYFKQKQVSFSKIPLLFTAIISIYFTARTVVRNSEWKNNLSIYEAGVQIVPNSVKTQFNLGTEQLELGNSTKITAERKNWYISSTESFKKAIDCYPRYSNIYENLIYVYGELSKTEIDTALRKDWLLEGLKYYNVSVDSFKLTKDGINQNASFILTELISIEKDDVLRNGYLKQLLGVVQNKLTYTADDFHNELYALYELKEDKELLKCIKAKAYEFPEKADLLSAISQQYFGKKEFELSLEILNVYLEIRPDDLSTLSNKGMLLEIMGKKDLALKVYEEVLSKDPNHAHAKQLYENLK